LKFRSLEFFLSITSNLFNAIFLRLDIIWLDFLVCRAEGIVSRFNELFEHMECFRAMYQKVLWSRAYQKYKQFLSFDRQWKYTVW